MYLRGGYGTHEGCFTSPLVYWEVVAAGGVSVGLESAVMPVVCAMFR